MAMSSKTVGSKPPSSGTKITRDDLEAKFRSVQEDMVHKVESKKQSVIASGAIALIVLLLIFFFLGKRSGKKKTTVVEIRRL